MYSSIKKLNDSKMIFYISFIMFYFTYLMILSGEIFARRIQDRVKKHFP